MIFVTLGTQDKSFVRLLDAIQKEINNGKIKDEVVVQAGFTKYASKNMKIYDLLDRDEFNETMNNCDLLITHGGVGSILTGLRNDKKVIVCPRLFKYKEHMNDHQLQITKNFASEGYIIPFYEEDNLIELIEKSKKFQPKKYKTNTKNMIKIIDDYISKTE